MSKMQSIVGIIIAVVLVVAVLLPIVDDFEESGTISIDSESEWEAWYEEYYLSSDIEYSTAYEYSRYAMYSPDYYSAYQVAFYNESSSIATIAYIDGGYLASVYDLIEASSLSAPLAVISNVFCASFDLESGDYKVWYINTAESDFDTSYSFYLDYIVYGEFVPDDGAYIYIEPYIELNEATYHLYYASGVYDDDGEEMQVYDLGELEYLLVPCIYGDYVMPVYDIGGAVDSDFDFSTYIGLGAEWHQSDYSYIWAFNTYYDDSAYVTYSVVAMIDASTMSGNATGYLHNTYTFTDTTAYKLESSDLDILAVSVSLSEVYEAYEYVASFTLTAEELEDSEIVADLANIPGLYVIVPMDYVGTEAANSTIANIIDAIVLLILVFVIIGAAFMIRANVKRG